MRNRSDKTDYLVGEDNPSSESNGGQEGTRLLSFPLRLVAADADVPASQTTAKPYDVAEYIAEMLMPLESLAQQNRLDVLGLMIAMAREQANDDVREKRQRR